MGEMRSLLMMLFSIVCVALLEVTPAPLQADQVASWQSIEDSTVQHLSSIDLWVGGAASIYDNGHVSKKTYGVATPGSASVVPRNASYEIGSITKSFTGILLALATQEIPGLTVDTQIGKFLSEVKNSYIGGLTLRQLATHTAGLPDDPPNLFTAPNYDAANAYGNYNEEQLLEYLNTATPVPGLIDPKNPGHYLYSYSNVGFSTLGLILTRVYKESYDDLVKSKITGPLKMSHTLVNRKTSPAPKNFLEPYNVIKIAVKHMPMDIYAPAGAIVSTLQDMTKYLRANLKCRGHLGAAMQMTHELGLGWDSFPGDGIIWKNGATNGFTNFITFDPKDLVGTVVLTNMRNILSNYVGALPIEQANQYPNSNIYTDFKQANFNQSTLPLSSSLMADYVGSYIDSDGQGLGDIKLQPQNGSMVFIYKGQPQLVALTFPSSPNSLWLDEGMIPAGTLSFVRDTDGKVTGFTAKLIGLGTYKYPRQ